MGFRTTASLKWSTTAAMAKTPPNRSYKLGSAMLVPPLPSTCPAGRHPSRRVYVRHLRMVLVSGDPAEGQLAANPQQRGTTRLSPSKGSRAECEIAARSRRGREARTYLPDCAG